MAMRKTKSGLKETDIRPLIHSLRGEGNCLHAVMTLTERLACKPEMLVTALSQFAGTEVSRTLVCRNGLLGMDGEEKLAALETL